MHVMKQASRHAYLVRLCRSVGCVMRLKEASSVVSPVHPINQLACQLFKRLCDTSTSTSAWPVDGASKLSSDVSLLKGSTSTARLGSCASRPLKLEQPLPGSNRRVRLCRSTNGRSSR